MQVNGSDRFWQPHQPAWISNPFYPPNFRYPFHCHTFAEVFWVVQGRIRHQVGDHEELLEAGAVRFLHPETGHALGAGLDSAVLVNFAFPAGLIEHLRPFAGELPFIAGQAPGFSLGPAGRAALAEWSDRFLSLQLTLADVGAFLLWLLAEVRRPPPPAAVNGPAWLDQALPCLEDPRALVLGAQALVERCGRSPNCVGRHVRHRFSCTTIQLVNRRRMAWLARQLRLTDAPIPELAAACGLVNLSHCYKQFRAAFGCTPGDYRQQGRGG
jgi:AraC family cel operon transcriptional repressor